MVIIRFNPDDCYDFNGRKVKGLFQWSLLLQYPTLIFRSIPERLRVLGQLVVDHVKNLPSQSRETIHLYYNGLTALLCCTLVPYAGARCWVLLLLKGGLSRELGTCESLNESWTGDLSLRTNL